MSLKTFIKNNYITLIFVFFCIGIFIGITGSLALVLISFFLYIYIGIMLNRNTSKDQIVQQICEIVGGAPSFMQLLGKKKKKRNSSL